MICEKCNTPLRRHGDYLPFLGMFIDWWDCPKCDNEEEGEKMDAKIKKIEKTNAKEGKQLKSLLKADKKQDKKMDKCDMMMKKKK